MTNGLYPGSVAVPQHFTQRIDPQVASVSEPTDWVGIAEDSIKAGEMCQLTESSLFRPMSPGLKATSSGDFVASIASTAYSLSTYAGFVGAPRTLQWSLNNIIETDDFHIVTLLTNIAGNIALLNRKALTAGTSDFPTVDELQVSGVTTASGIYKAGNGRFWMVTGTQTARLFDDRLNLIGGPFTVAASNSPSEMTNAAYDTSGSADLVWAARGASTGWYAARVNQSGTAVWTTSTIGSGLNLNRFLDFRRMANGDFVVKYEIVGPDSTRICRIGSDGTPGSVVTVSSTQAPGLSSEGSSHIVELSNGNIVVPFIGAGGSTDLAIYSANLTLITTIDLGTNLTPGSLLPAVVAWEGMFTVGYANGTSYMVRTFANSGELLQTETTILSVFASSVSAQARSFAYRTGSVATVIESGANASGGFMTAFTFAPWGLVNSALAAITSTSSTNFFIHTRPVITRAGMLIVHTNGESSTSSVPRIFGCRGIRGTPFGVARHSASRGERVVLATVGHFQLPRHQWAPGIGLSWDHRANTSGLWGNKGSWVGSSVMLNGLTTYSNQ